ncbi:Aste57867_23433 [Aphanomyces stellatus]|uniref:Aste57867_23433 protein n=1 Tax=Aphanomyces stellatus TaxID=120398 RepID=A0A485LS93_9STRA|nr:hypothetical protein As57867_023362 [Aphanomyces stellatus]VFU00079.1 Aste57867_23433 [Aphanomyces stellatus]
MDASTRIMVQSAALQARMTVPSAHHDNTTSHYRLVDSHSALKQKEERESIIREIQAKRASKRLAAKMVHPFESALSVHGSKPRVKMVSPTRRAHKFTSSRASERHDIHPHDPIHDDDDDDVDGEATRTTTSSDYIHQLEMEIQRLKTKPSSNQIVQDNQVLQKLAEFKAAQQRDLEVVERLVREKKEAEQRAERLERQLAQTTSTRRASPEPHVDCGDESVGPLTTVSSVGNPPSFDDIGFRSERNNTTTSPPRKNRPSSAAYLRDFSSPPARQSKAPTARPSSASATWATRQPSRGSTTTTAARATSKPSHATRLKSNPRPKEMTIEEDEPGFGGGGDECAAPGDVDMGPRTASSLGEPPGFDDVKEATVATTPRSHNTTWATKASDRSSGQSTSVMSIDLVSSSAEGGDSASKASERGGSFFQEKERARREQLELERLARDKLERAKRATPPTGGFHDVSTTDDRRRRSGLLTNEAKLRERKQQTLAERTAEEDEKLQPFKARDAPAVPDTDVELAEVMRQERVAARAAALLAQSKLPSRLADAAAKPKRVKRPSPPKRVRLKAAPVPDFAMMQSEWKAALQRTKMNKSTTHVDAFSVTDPDKMALLKKKKQERLARQAEKEQAQRQAEEAARKAAYDKAMEGTKGVVKVSETESHKLRTQAVQSKLKQRTLKEKAEAAAQLKRNAKIQQVSKQVKAEVSQLEKQRREEKGNFVDPDEAAKTKAEENKRSFQEAIQRNKERIMGAVAARPTLMERFAIDKKKDESKKQALAAVVSNVFGKNIAAFKGVLTEGEEDLVDAMDLNKSSTDNAGGEEE